MKKAVIIIVSLVVLILMGYMGYLFINKDIKEISDNQKFSAEYKGVGLDNVFTYKTIEETIKILEHGTGVVYLGFPSCPWCQKYVTILNEVALNNKLDKINYCNISEDRANNTKNYQKLVSLLDDYLHYDDDGNKRIYVPAIIAIKEGQIVFFDDETSYDTKGYATPDEYWLNEDLEGLKQRLSEMITKVKPPYCDSECNA